MRHVLKTTTALVLATGAISLMAAPALAQTAPTSQPETQETSVLDEIVVTARRSSENVQSTPLTVAAFGAESLRQASIRETQDVMFAVPGVYMSGSGAKENATYSIRGQSRPNAGAGQAGVASYFAEVPLPGFGNASQTYDLSSLQVLKGPQGTLFGRNTTGGAVLLYPTAPTHTLGGYFQGTFGNYDLHDFEGAVNLPLIEDKVALRVAGRVARRDGTTKNLGTGGDLDNVHSDQVRVSLRLNPVDWIENTTTFDYRRTDQTTLASVLVVVNPRADEIGLGALLRTRLAEQQARGNRVVDYGSFQPLSRQEHSILVNRTSFQLGSVELVNIFGYQDLTWIFDTNPDAIKDPIGIVDAHNIYSNRQTTNEIQLKGTAFGGSADWLLGAFYYFNKPGDQNLTNFPTFFGQVYNQAKYTYQEDTSKALFTNINYHADALLEGLTFSVGFRYTWDETKGCGGTGEHEAPYLVTPDTCSVTNPIFTPGTAFELTTKSSAPTWTLGVDWKVNRDLFVYATTRRGYRSGGLNFPQLGPAIRDLQSFAPEEVTDLEGGVKSEWAVGSVKGRLNVAGFITKAKNVQYPLAGLSTQPGCIAGDPIAGAPPFTPDGDCNPANDPSLSALLLNAGDTTVKGIEIDATIIPIQNLRLTAHATIMTQETDKFTLPAYLSVYGTAANNEIPFYFSPLESYSVQAHYDIPLSGNNGELGLTWDTYWTGAVQYGGYRAKPYSLSNARVDWNNALGAAVDVGLFVKNVFDEEAVITAGFSSPGGPSYTVNFSEPRTYGIQLRYRFNQ